MSSNNKKASGGNKALIAVIIILIVVIVAGVVVIVSLLNKKDEKEEAVSTTGRGTVVTSENAEETVAALESVPVEDGYFKTSQTIDWHFNTDGVTEDAYIGNSEDNGHTVYFDLNMEDSGETIYSSPFIPVGMELNGFTLDKKLEPGTYDTIMVYHLVDDNEKEISTLSVALTIYVE